MHRTFPTTTTRARTYLDGTWDFVVDPDDRGLNEGWYEHLPQPCEQLWVPGVWNTSLGYLRYEGAAWYRVRFKVGACAAMALEFAAVTHQANVWLDGEPLGEHYGGFLPFGLMVREPAPGEHELIVRVDNTHDMTCTIPSATVDWFRYGGIPRPVWVDELPGPGCINSLRLVPIVRDGRALLRVRAELSNLTSAVLDEPWTLYLDDQPLKSGRLRIEGDETEVLLFAVDVPDARLWSPEHPQLYTVRLAFDGDDRIDRTGFRELRVQGREVLLNDEPLRLRGVNRHEDHPDWGFALPEHVMLRDLELIRDLGANTIRGAHYPNDQRFLDFCDERGILFMEQLPLSGLDREQLRQDVVASRAAAMAWGMVERDVAHPCIWSWSLLNECATDSQEGRALLEDLIETVREVDPTRPLTYASHSGLNDAALDLADIVSVNGFFGWYSRDATWGEFLDRMRARIGERPLLVTEFGADGIFGCHSLEEGAMWSEEYQRQLLCDSARLFEARDDLLGYLIWQFCDSRADMGRAALMRPRGYNNKGLLDEYRRPKDAYRAVRELWREKRGG